MHSDLIAKAGVCASASAWTVWPQAPKLAGLQPSKEGNSMELNVRAVDVGFGNTKFITGMSGSEVRCGCIPSLASPSTRDPASLPAAERRKTLAIPINGLYYEVGPVALATDNLEGRAGKGGHWHARHRQRQRQGRDHTQDPGPGAAAGCAGVLRGDAPEDGDDRARAKPDHRPRRAYLREDFDRMSLCT
jgi:hypothetical protein